MAGATSQESLTAALDDEGVALEPLDGSGDALGGRTYLVSAAPGQLVLRYAMTQDGAPAFAARLRQPRTTGHRT